MAFTPEDFLNAPNKTSFTDFMRAVDKATKDFFNAPNKTSFTDFMRAVDKATDDKIRDLIAAGDVNAKTDDGTTALMFVVRQSIHLRNWSWRQRFSLLIEAGVDVNAKDNNGSTALMQAVTTNQHFVEALIKAGANVNAKDNNGSTALMQAAGAAAHSASMGYDYRSNYITEFSAIGSLIRAGADVNAKDTNGKTALMFAVDSGSKERVRTPHDLALGSESWESRSNAIVSALIGAGALVNIKATDGTTALKLCRSDSMRGILLDAGSKQSLFLYLPKLLFACKRLRFSQMARKSGLQSTGTPSRETWSRSINNPNNRDRNSTDF
jgi:ankyrin repeat protein